MDEKGKNGGTAVSPAPAESAQQLLDRLTEAAARLQERDARQQAQRLEALQHQIEASSQELETARLHTAQGEEAQQSLQQFRQAARAKQADKQHHRRQCRENFQSGAQAVPRSTQKRVVSPGSFPQPQQRQCAHRAQHQGPSHAIHVFPSCPSSTKAPPPPASICPWRPGWAARSPPAPRSLPAAAGSLRRRASAPDRNC